MRCMRLVSRSEQFTHGDQLARPDYSLTFFSTVTSHLHCAVYAYVTQWRTIASRTYQLMNNTNNDITHMHFQTVCNKRKNILNTLLLGGYILKD